MINYIFLSFAPKARTTSDLFYEYQVCRELYFGCSTHFLCFYSLFCGEQTPVILIFSISLVSDFLSTSDLFMNSSDITLVYSWLLLTHCLCYLKVFVCLLRWYYHKQMLIFFCVVQLNFLEKIWFSQLTTLFLLGENFNFKSLHTKFIDLYIDALQLPGYILINPS